ncbi:MAG: peptide chain release factor 2 [Candidatus Aminicenantes bacterium]|nr:peptide chain release factor 2 [Candidatus Aminicenantes bacterium]
MKEKEDLKPKKTVADLKSNAKKLTRKFEDLRGYFDPDHKISRIKTLEKELSSPDVWKNQSKLKSLQKEKKRIEDSIASYKKIKEIKEEIDVLLELSSEGEDILSDLSKAVSDFQILINNAELEILFFEKDDPRNAILTIHPGAGGTESQDWAEMLLRMYLRYAERKNFTSKILDLQQGDEAGLKSATIQIDGDYAYGIFRQESGVHRLVRISPFDANKRRHTSFAAVFAYPEIDEDIEIDISPDEIRVDTYRSSGRGGQHVNVTDSAVRITHIETGIVVQCQNERSQHKNKASALKVLKSRLYELEKRKKNEKLEKLEDAKSDIAWGNQIRSYVLHPYQMIKDLRTNVETGDTEGVLDGDLDEFIKASLIQRKENQKD